MSLRPRGQTSIIMAAKGSVEDIESVQVDALVSWLNLQYGKHRHLIMPLQP